jgi:hypothetical protein
MALIYSSSVSGLVIYQGLQSVIHGTAGAVGMSVYSGTQPTAAQVTSNWSTYNSSSSNFLLHYTGAVWSQPVGSQLQLTTIPASATSAQTATATWCIIWAAAVTAVNVASTTLPNTSFIVVSCTDNMNNGVIRFTNTSFTSGQSVTILDGSFYAY